MLELAHSVEVLSLNSTVDFLDASNFAVLAVVDLIDQVLVTLLEIGLALLVHLYLALLELLKLEIC